MSKRDKQLREDVIKKLYQRNPQMSLKWLKRLSKQELKGLWIALNQNSDEDDLIRF